MKKLIVLSMVIALLLSVCACADSDTHNDNNADHGMSTTVGGNGDEQNTDKDQQNKPDEGNNGSQGGTSGDEESPKPPHIHTYASDWSSDAESHWFEPICEDTDKKVMYGPHRDLDVDGVCDMCYYRDESHNHEFSKEWVYDDIYHWHDAECEHIGAVSEKAEHIDENNDDECDICRYNLWA